ncbi:hypothetical protein [Promicromonospora sp. NPDC060271]|uniref:hypothetical protein n=1 Tax=Promicromonospora sp. NPDC060271 TaxID=3347089 RepID=UPI003664D920
MFGRDDFEWQRLIEAGTAFLVEQARLRRTTTYTEMDATLARRTGLRRFDFSQVEERAAIGELLGRIVRSDIARTAYADGPLMLSALVMYLNENDAGTGFYVLAEELGLLSPGATRMSKERFWIDQVTLLQAHYAAPR